MRNHAFWLCLFLCSCSASMEEPLSETDAGEAQVTALDQGLTLQTCRPSWVPLNNPPFPCKIDKDNHVVYNTFELTTADQYRDNSGCFPDAYQLRKFDRVKCDPTLSAEECLGLDRVFEGDFCPRPRLSEFAGTITAPTTVTVYPGPLGAGSAYVCWNSPYDTAQVIATSRGTERLFGAGRSGCLSEDNIHAGETHVLTLYTDSSRAIALAESSVTGIASACPPGQGPRCGEPCMPPGSGCK